MSYITREDGEHFVIPSYRDVLTARQKSQLKKDILLLSESYGDYITLRKRGATQYEVAFSPDPGYLLGETVWEYFKKPTDLIYCEAIPNTQEAILVIVKQGSVYLDGSFPIESITEELVIFLTQHNEFEIYIYGDVPISQFPVEGKINFEADSVKAFKVLDQPVFPTLPLLRVYQLQLVDTALRAQGIGVFPIQRLIGAVVAAVLLWMLYSYITTKPIAPPPKKTEVNPYQEYITSLTTAAPSDEVAQFVNQLTLLFTMPGWQVKKIQYTHGVLNATVISNGGSVANLMEWTKNNAGVVNIKQDGIYVALAALVTKRPVPTQIYATKEVLATLLDRLRQVYPGNNIQINGFKNKVVYTDVTFTINLTNVSPAVLTAIGATFKDLPLVLNTIDLTVNNGSISGKFTMEALGS